MSIKQQKKQIVLLLLIFLFGISLFLVKMVFNSSISQEQRVENILNKYVEQGLTFSEFLENKSISLTRSDWTFIFRAGSTPEEVLAEAKKIGFEEDELYDINLSDFIKKISLDFVKGTDYENKVKLNEISAPDSLNIFLLKEDPEKLVRHFDNCSYIGYMNAILCNVNFLENQINYIEKFDKAYSIRLISGETGKFLDPFSAGNEWNAQRVKAGIVSGFLTWVIGHEIGHAVCHKDYVINSGKGVHFDSDGYTRREEEADIFVVEALQKNSQEKGLATETTVLFWANIGEYFQHVYRDEVSNYLKARISDYAWDSKELPLFLKFNLEKNNNEQPYLLRILNLLVTLTETIPSVDETGFYAEGIQPNIQTIPSRFDIALKYFLMIGVPVLAIFAIVLPIQSKRKRQHNN